MICIVLKAAHDEFKIGLVFFYRGLVQVFFIKMHEGSAEEVVSRFKIGQCLPPVEFIQFIG